MFVLALFLLLNAAAAPARAGGDGSGGDGGTGYAAPALTPDSFYRLFNMRSIRSSMGPTLKAYCGSYPREFFTIVEQSDDRLKLNSFGSQYWTIYFEDGNTIVIDDVILAGTYRWSEEYHLTYDPARVEWRAGVLRNKRDPDCDPHYPHRGQAE